MDSFTIYDEEFGDITLKVDARACRYTFRVKSGSLSITLPLLTKKEDILSIIEENRFYIRKLWLKHKDERLSAGTVIETHCFTIAINLYQGDKILYTLKNGNLDISFPSTEDISDEVSQKMLRSGIMYFLRRSSEPMLKERLDRLASALKLNYRSFIISYGRSRLGKCDTKRNITLSCYLAFYPFQLIDYVILHELAHLTEMNHGADFHNLCNRYCGGNEKSLQQQLRRFPLPL